MGAMAVACRSETDDSDRNNGRLTSQRAPIVQSGMAQDVKSDNTIGMGSRRTAASVHPAPVELVIVVFRERLAWIEHVVARITPRPHVRLLCKGHVIQDPRCHYLDNVGTEEYGFISHILENYDRLAPITVFLNGNPCNSAFDCVSWRSLNYVLKHIGTPQVQVVFSGFAAMRVAPFDQS